MDKEKRTVQMLFRVTEKERELIAEKMAAAGILNREAYFRKMSLDGYIIKLDFSALKDLTRLLSIVANNINQIAKRANETRSIYASDIKDIQDKYDSLWIQADAILRSITNIQR